MENYYFPYGSFTNPNIIIGRYSGEGLTPEVRAVINTPEFNQIRNAQVNRYEFWFNSTINFIPYNGSPVFVVDTAGNLTHEGNLLTKRNLTVTEDVSVGKNLTVNENILVRKDVRITGDLYVTGNVVANSIPDAATIDTLKKDIEEIKNIKLKDLLERVDKLEKTSTTTTTTEVPQ